MLAAGIAGLVYSKFGPRLGYGNAQNVWLVTGLAFVLSFIICLTTIKFLLPL